MRFTVKDTTFNFAGSGCILQYVGVQPLRIEISENNIDFVEGFINKLGQLEDIEEELGIDLITLFKILKANECYSKEDGECRIVGIDMNGAILMPKKFPFGECEFTVPFTEFGKTWALAKEELEKKL